MRIIQYIYRAIKKYAIQLKENILGQWRFQTCSRYKIIYAIIVRLKVEYSELDREET